MAALGGCWGSAPPTHDDPPPEPAHPPIEPARPRTVTWQGWYVCAQGKTALTLTVTGDPSALVGTFEFGPLPENPTVPHGKYTLHGRAERLSDGEYQIALEPDRWIEHPPDYYMVGLEARSSREHDALAGKITDRNCSNVVLSRKR